MCYTVVWDKAVLETIKREVVDKKQECSDELKLLGVGGWLH